MTERLGAPGVAHAPLVVPPAANRLYSELGRVCGNAHADPSSVRADVVDAVGVGTIQLAIDEVVSLDFLGEDSSAPATAALTTTQVEGLVATSNMDLPREPTIQQALMAVAALGRHIGNNGDPGWLVLGRGYDRWIAMETAWTAARRGGQS